MSIHHSQTKSSPWILPIQNQNHLFVPCKHARTEIDREFVFAHYRNVISPLLTGWLSGNSILQHICAFFKDKFDAGTLYMWGLIRSCELVSSEFEVRISEIRILAPRESLDRGRSKLCGVSIYDFQLCISFSCIATKESYTLKCTKWSHA